MDSLAFVGLFMGIAAVWYTMLKGHILEVFFNFPSLVLVIGGTLASTLMTYPWEVIKNVPRSIVFAFFPQKRTSPHSIIERVCQLSEISVVRGVDMLSDQMTDDDDEFLKSSVKMLLNDWSEQEIRESMENEMASTLERHQQVQKVFLSIGSYAPVYGLLGTLVGVLGVLRYLGDPSAMGSAMTVAIITTFYGIFVANFIALPIAGKLETYSSQELLTKQLVMMGVLGMKKEMYPYMLKERMGKYLAQSLRTES